MAYALRHMTLIMDHIYGTHFQNDYILVIPTNSLNLDIKASHVNAFHDILYITIKGNQHIP